MQNNFDNHPPGNPFSQFNPENLDFSKLSRLTKWIVMAIAVLVLWNLATWGMSFYRDWLWFSNLGHQSVLLKVMSTRIGLFVAGFAVFLGLAVFNLRVVLRAIPRSLPKGDSNISPAAYKAAITLLVWLGWAAAVLGAVFLALRLAGEWELFLRFFHAVPFNETEPIFDKDFSFYIFTLPALDFLRLWLMGSLVVIGLGALALYYFSVSLKGERFILTPAIRSHLALLGAFIFLLVAAGHWLARYDLLLWPTGAVYGVG